MFLKNDTTSYPDWPPDGEVVKVYVGTQIEQLLAFEVLHYSIKKHTHNPVVLIPLFKAVEAAGIQIPTPTNPQLRPRTPFSFQRFAIPQLNGYRGRAIYLDSDMQVFRDILELWSYDFDGADLLSVYEPPHSGRCRQFSVMVLNCQQLQWDVVTLVNQLEQGRWSYEEFVLAMAPANRIAAILPTGWNDLERYTPNKTALVHYTDMNTQPWLVAHNPLGHLWCRELIDAVDRGFIQLAFVQDEVKLGHVRPSLLYQIEHHIIDPRQLPQAEIRHDRLTFVPPHILSKINPKSTPTAKPEFFGEKTIRFLYAQFRILLNRYP